jgi:alkylation response protein AidB-like acyl-CoA dehydrogenase
VDFELTDEQCLLRDVSRSMLATHCPPALVRSLADSNRDVDDKLWQRGVELGWIGLGVADEQGGSGQGLAELCLVSEEIGRAVAPGPITDSALIALAASRSESESARAVAGDLATGARRASVAHHGSVTAVRNGDTLVLDGQLTAVQAAAAVDWLMITTSTTDGPALVLVETSDVTVNRRRTLDQTRGWYDVIVAEVHVPIGQLVSADDAEVQWLLDAAAVLTCADSLGLGERLLEMTVDHVKTREQFGRALGSFQSVKHKAAEMLTTVKGARAATYYAAMALDARAGDSSLASSVAKAFCGEGVSALAGEALQTHGGIGFTWEHDLHLYLRRAKVDEVLYGGPTEHHERVVALLE